MKNSVSLLPSWWACLSGGKDSFYMFLVIISNLKKYPLNGVVHFELEIDFPFIKDVIDYMESECKKLGIPFIRIKPSSTWEDLYKKYHLPSRVARWCNSKYKLSAKENFINFQKSLGYSAHFYIGYCVDEKQRYKNRLKFNERYPLVEENINEDFILEWAKNVPIYKDYYKFNRRCGCYLCPMVSLPNLAYLLKYYPSHYDYFFDKIRDSEQYFSTKLGKPYYFKYNYTSDYLDYLIKTKYLPLLESALKSSQISFFYEDYLIT